MIIILAVMSVYAFEIHVIIKCFLKIFFLSAILHVHVCMYDDRSIVEMLVHV